ncbi:hypothetical protein K440DRAFT_630329 [Wilcoxina mikolae CBS 423.85]|nr:hypothetical protein K440DRAFT_630329 [Wilcoxina mikolae CBS 423.85]
MATIVSKPNSNKLTPSGTGEQRIRSGLSNPPEDKKIVSYTANLSQLIQQHVTNFYNMDECKISDPIPFGFVPLTPRCVEVAFRRYIGIYIITFIQQSIECGMEEEEVHELHRNLCKALESYRSRAADDRKAEAHLLALFESGHTLAGMLASGQVWKFGSWDTLVEPSTEASQMQLLVFPPLFKNNERVKRGEQGNGEKRSTKESVGASEAEPMVTTGSKGGLVKSIFRAGRKMKESVNSGKDTHSTTRSSHRTTLAACTNTNVVSTAAHEANSSVSRTDEGQRKTPDNGAERTRHDYGEEGISQIEIDILQHKDSADNDTSIVILLRLAIRLLLAILKRLENRRDTKRDAEQGSTRKLPREEEDEVKGDTVVHTT